MVVYTLPTERKEKEMMQEAGTIYEFGTKIRVSNSRGIMQFNICIATVDIESGYGYDAELTVCRLTNSKWRVEENSLAQLVNKTFDSWVFENGENNSRVWEVNGIESLAEFLASEYDSKDKGAIITALVLSRTNQNDLPLEVRSIYP
jgi:hypothetical protein